MPTDKHGSYVSRLNNWSRSALSAGFTDVALFDTNVTPWTFFHFAFIFRCLAIASYVYPEKYCRDVGP